MATCRPWSCSSRANFSTTGVLPVPPTVKLPIAMTWTPSVESRKIRAWYRNRRDLTANRKSLEIMKRIGRTRAGPVPFRPSTTTSLKKVSPASTHIRNRSRISSPVCQEHEEAARQGTDYISALRLGQLANFDFAQCGTRLPRTNAEWLRHFDVARTHGDLFPLDLHVHQPVLVNPHLNLLLGHAHTNPVPLPVLEITELGRLIFRSVHSVQAGDADQRPAPPADNQAARVRTHRHGQPTKKVRAIHAHRVQRNLVVHGWGG